MELFQLSDHLPLAKEVLQEVSGTPPENEVLKRLTRRRRRLVNERVRVVNNLQADLQAVCPGLLEITAEASNQWFLNFLLSADTLPQLARLRRNTLLKIPSVGVKCVAIIEGWQKRAHFSQEVEWVGEMIQEDATRCLELDGKIKRLEAKIAEVAKDPRSPRLYDRFRGLVPCVLQNWPERLAPLSGLPPKQVFPCILACPRWTTGRGNTREPRRRST